MRNHYSGWAGLPKSFFRPVWLYEFFHIPVLPLLCVVAAVPVAATLRYGRALLAPHEDEDDVRRPGVNGRRGSSADRPVPAVPVS